MACEVNNLIKTKISVRRVKKVIKNTFSKLKIHPSKSVSVALVGETAIKKLNKKYRRKDKVTSVLSFPLGKKDLILPPKAGSYLGEIIICPAQAKKRAKKNKRSLAKEIDFLLIHGLLHLLGFNHQQKKEVNRMKKMEEELINE